MKTQAATLLILAMSVATSVFACDEACLKEKAEKANNVEFASYLSWEFCDNTRMEFMTAAMSSLENYSTEHFDTRYKGGMRNIKQFIENRKDWLEECDQYTQLTSKGRIFDDAKTTKAIFASMDSVSKELGNFIAGASYSGGQSKVIMNEKFQDLFTKVDDHKTLMHLKGKYVYRH